MAWMCGVTSESGTDLSGNGGCSAHLSRLCLLGTFSLEFGEDDVTVGDSAQRLLTLLAVQDGPMSRQRVARTLWPDLGTDRSRATLRCVLWRLQRLPVLPVCSTGATLRLSDALAVDVLSVVRIATALLDRSASLSDRELSNALQLNFYDDLLPEREEEGAWLDDARERFRQLRLHCLEVLCEKLSAAGWHGAAVDAGLAAVRADPLRESAHYALIRAHLVEGNRREASRRYEGLRELVVGELGIEPNVEFGELLNIRHDPFTNRAETRLPYRWRTRDERLQPVCCTPVD
jgi:DNA-binding SARP family transcriptional activator